MIREMNTEDLAVVSEIEKMCFTMPWSRDGFEAALSMQGNVFIVYEKNDEILGYCGYYGVLDEAEITNVAVHPDMRNRGIGRDMVSALLSKANKAGIKRVLLEVRESNDPAIHLYEELGFKKLGIRKDFYEQPRENAYIMEMYFD
ncbi:MAG: ribosomal protein S18-alanine N-acetyltransferase [Lachnospiraceae bacterium]|nr:ribosomal protein S18-alanine N-acetyltransferase [Lachnospiraceae bacterium]MBR4795637.1 ribosomal protein S18-alanine N-acetyltransferase [Lachnospiraceae bacterium]MBR5789174.1 ribosomal protein S18-alanine N-acetyltransferase [Lachnospiraceae bacterium]